MAINTLFPTYIYQDKLKQKNLEKLNSELLDEVKKLQEIDNDGLYWSATNYVGGYTSYSSYSELHNFSSTFGELKDLIDKHVRAFVQYIEFDIDASELSMSSCWVNVMPANTTHSMHLHPLSVISGTYYLSVPKGASGIKFEDPRLDRFMGCPPRKSDAKKKNKTIVNFKPKAGDVILFESWLRHEVPASSSDFERISISFNYDW